MDQNDEEIARKVQSGDTQSFGILVERYEEKLSRYARRFLFGRDDVKDLVQDVFLKAYTNILGFDANERFSPWIYRIAHNEFINALKRRRYQPLAFFDPDTIFPHPEAKEHPESESEKRELCEHLERFLGDIDAKYREPLILYYYDDLSYKDIADVLKIPVSTVGIRIKRGKDRLKKMCEELGINLYYGK